MNNIINNFYLYFISLQILDARKFIFHPEILSVISMALPGLFTIYFFFIDESKLLNPFFIKLSGISCIMHFPWSAALHIHRAYGIERCNMRVFLYKMDILFQHIYSICTRYGFSNNISFFELLFHIFCILYLFKVDPIKYPQRKKIVSILSATGLGSCIIDLYKISKFYFYLTLIISTFGFIIHYKTLIGIYSPFWFHFCLGFSHLFIFMSNLYHTD